VIVAGSVRPQPVGATPDPLISSVMVRRYTAGGALDTSFGDGGTVLSAFGVEAPKIGANRYAGRLSGSAASRSTMKTARY
jgi:hypothetical protein